MRVSVIDDTVIHTNHNVRNPLLPSSHVFFGHEFACLIGDEFVK